jgi:hypothetical protein
MQKPYRLTRDPLFFAVTLFFAIFTTAIGGLLGLLTLLPLLQTLALFILLSVAVRAGDRRGALTVVGLFVVGVLAAATFLTLVAPGQMEQAIANGFEHRARFLEWHFAGAPLPAGWSEQPAVWLAAIASATIGSLVTGGLTGTWVIVTTANLTGYQMGALWEALGMPAALLIGLTPWSLLLLAGFGTLTAILADPAWRGGLRTGWAERRRPLLAGTALAGAGLLLLIFLPSYWHFG